MPLEGVPTTDVGADGVANALALTTMLIGVGDAVMELMVTLGDVVLAVSVPLVIAIRTVPVAEAAF
jgi:hypothetical protein